MDITSATPAVAVRAFFTEAAVLALAVAIVAFALRRTVWAQAAGGGAPEAPWQRWLRAGLGALWLFDGLLQAQPGMVTRFIGGLLAPLLTGQPGWLASVMEIGIRLWGVAPVQANLLACFLQLLIGATLLFAGRSRLVRAALWASVAWGAAIWVVGEGLGGMLVGGNWLSGAPGSVFLYVAAAVLLLVPTRLWRDATAFPRRLSLGMAALLGASAFLQAWPAAGGWRPGGLSAYALAMAQMPQPTFVAAPLYAWSAALHAHPAAWNAMLVVVLAALALGWLLVPARRELWWATVVWTAATWWIGQDLGVFGGMSTDPNTGAILLVLLAAYGREMGWIGAVRKAVPASDGQRVASHAG